jgi:hypothetical protein
MIFFLGFLVVDAILGAFSAREAFTNAMNKVIASQASATSTAPVFVSSPTPAWDSSCFGLNDGKPAMTNRCHSEMMWAREQTSTPYVQPAPPVPTMSKGESEQTALWFGATMLAGLLALGAAGAGAMWFLRE